VELAPPILKYVPTSEEGLDGNEGLIYTKGWRSSYNSNGTFSLWKDFESVKQFVSKQHKEAKKTREYEWYSEELFSRFQPINQVVLGREKQ
jgi:hypothetical protein